MTRFPRAYQVLIVAVLLAGAAYAQDTIHYTGGSVTTIPAISTGVSTTASPTYPDVTVTTGNGTSSAFHIFSSTSELLRVQANGQVGIGLGASNPADRLDVNGGNLKVTNTNGAYNGIFYSGDPNWGFAVVHPSSPSDDYEVRLNYFPNGGIARKAGIFNIASSSYVLYADANTTPNVIIPSGNVGIGVLAPPAQKLVVGGNIQMSPGGILYGDSTDQALSLSVTGAFLNYNGANYTKVGGNVTDLATNAGVTLRVYDGKVGIGSDVPSARLQIGSYLAPAQFQDMIAQGVPNGMKLNMAGSSEIDVAGLQIGQTGLPVIQSTTGTLYLNRTSPGDVWIGSSSNPNGLQVKGTGMSPFAGPLTVTGTITATTVYANYQDVAEWVPAAESMPAGTVVVISNDTNNTVTASTRSYDTGVAGVVSANPGLLLGVASASKGKIATTGRVRVRVDARKQPIPIGDLLVTIRRPPVPINSTPPHLSRAQLHPPPTLLGKGLEPLPNGEGDILVLLSLQ